MKDDKLRVGSRLLIGGIAGFVGALAMTAAMRRMQERLPPSERLPRPPRGAAGSQAASGGSGASGTVDPAAAQAGAPPPSEGTKDVTTAAHFAYGAASGALLGVANVMVGPVSGGLAGMGVWLASYMGWIPGAGVLKPAAGRPRRRHLVALAAYVVWGVTTARTMRELVAARDAIIEEDKAAPPRLS